MGDWSAVYLDNTLRTGPGFAAAGYAAFSVSMAFGRLFGDRFTERLGPATLVRSCGALAAVSTAAYTGFLVGPPSIGFLAELTGLGYALYLVVALSIAIAISAGAVNTGACKAK